MFKESIAEMKALARSRGGNCLSEEYCGVDAKLKWRCASGHVWENRPAKIKKGQWCPFCQGKHKTIADMKAFAKSRGGECLSENYTSSSTPLRWRCDHGHEWEARPSNVLFGTWCPYCRGQRQTVADLKNLAKGRGGDCLSSDYRGAAKKHLWRCRDGHTWQATPNSIKNGSWCPQCHVNYGEEICRAYFEAIFSKPFPKCRPDFLKTRLRGVMELDGYCAELSLAFEHHGLQHYETVEHFHPVGKGLELQRERDAKKRKLCDAAGVSVVEIPSVPDLTPLSELPKVIARELETLRIHAPISPEEVSVKLDGIYDCSCLERLQQMAKAKGGRLLSDVYLGDRTKLRWQCAAGHEWDAAPNNIKSGAWCAMCYGNVLKSITEVLDAVAAKGILLLSTEYRGTNFKLKWRCAKGHEWMATPHRVMHNTGCPHCAGQNKSIADMQEVAKRNGGRCLSEKYRSVNSHLEWECAVGHRFRMTPNIAVRKEENWCPKCQSLERNRERGLQVFKRLSRIAQEHGGRVLDGDYHGAHGKLSFECALKHRWQASATSISNGKWCPECASIAHRQRCQNARCGLEQMKTLAAKRGGECLSQEYVSNRSKLRWRCSNGHEWDAIPSNIKKGRWCPYCAGKKRKTVADMHELARMRGFQFVSEVYLGDDKHHRWQCQNGHQWNAKPSNIKQGRGCPECAKKTRPVRRRARMLEATRRNEHKR